MPVRDETFNWHSNLCHTDSHPLSFNYSNDCSNRHVIIIRAASIQNRTRSMQHYHTYAREAVQSATRRESGANDNDEL